MKNEPMVPSLLQLCLLFFFEDINSFDAVYKCHTDINYVDVTTSFLNRRQWKIMCLEYPYKWVFSRYPEVEWIIDIQARTMEINSKQSLLTTI